MRARLLAAVAALIPLTAIAADWVLVSDDDELTVEMDRASLKQDGNVVRAWSRWNTKRPTEAYGKTYQSFRALDFYNCVERTSAMRQVAFYSGPNLDGEVVGTQDNSDSELEWTDVPPDAKVETLLDFACKNAPKAAAKK